MTDAERKALVERMAIGHYTRVRRDCTAEEAALSWRGMPEDWKEAYRADMRAALSEAERVVREDERDACCNVAFNEMRAAEADVETASDGDLVARLQSQGAASAAGRIATFLRARGAA